MLAFTRAVSPAFDRCELTHVERVPIDLPLAIHQHEQYERTLERLGCRIERLPSDASMPDAVFIEDTAVPLEEVILITRPGAASRRGEVAGVEETVKRHRLLSRIETPGTVDGGDVLVAGRTLFVGRSQRTNAEGIAQIGRVAGYFGYVVTPIPVGPRLHLKSAVTTLAGDTLLIDRTAVPAESFAGFQLVDVHPSEPAGANVLRIGDRLIAAAAFPRTNERLAGLGYDVSIVDVSEIAKAEGAVTCCSLILDRSEQDNAHGR